MVVGGARDGPQRLLPDAVLVHEAGHAHGVPLGGRQQAIGCEIGCILAVGANGCAVTVTAVLALGDAAEHHHAGGRTGDHRRRGVGDRRRPPAAAAPEHVGVAELRQAERRGQPRGIVAVGTEGGEAVDSPRVHPGVGAGGQDRAERQLELGVLRPAMLVEGRLADAHDGRAATEWGAAHAPPTARLNTAVD